MIPSDRASPSFAATATSIVSAWTSKPTNFILFIDRLLSHVALRCDLPIHSVTHGLRIGAGRSIVTTAESSISTFPLLSPTPQLAPALCSPSPHTRARALNLQLRRRPPEYARSRFSLPKFSKQCTNPDSLKNPDTKSRRHRFRGVWARNHQ